ncbi:hypothetical protein M8C21_032410, partial [Ambrosia artemisiifolia]
IPTLIVSSPEVAQEILKTHDSLFASRPNLTIPNMVLYGCKDISFSPNGEYWRQLKSMVVKHLLSNAQVKSLQNVRENEIGHMIEVLKDNYGSVSDISALFDSLTTNIVCMATLGKKNDVLELKTLIKNFFDVFTFFSVGSYVPWLSWVDHLTGLVGRAKNVAKEFDEFLEGVIEEHEAKKGGEDAKSNDGQDFIDILLNVQKDGTTDFTFQRDTVKAVIMEDLEKMHYLRAVIKENFRLHMPAALLVPRMATEDVKVMGYDIRAGTQVIVNAWAIGRDPTLWEEPEEFRPERFLKNPFSYKGVHFEWLPFGAGRRSCPGVQFGVAIVELALANIVYRFDVGLPNGVKHEDLDMSETFGLVVHKKSPLLVTATPRF